MEALELVWSVGYSFNAPEFSQYDIIVDIRNEEKALIAYRSIRARSRKFQFDVVNRNRSRYCVYFNPYRENEDELEQVQHQCFGVNGRPITSVDFDRFYMRHEVAKDCVLVLSNKCSDDIKDLLFPYLRFAQKTKITADPERISAFCAIPNIDEIYDKLKNADLDKFRGWPKLIKDPNASSLKDIFKGKFSLMREIVSLRDFPVKKGSISESIYTDEDVLLVPIFNKCITAESKKAVKEVFAQKPSEISDQSSYLTMSRFDISQLDYIGNFLSDADFSKLVIRISKDPNFSVDFLTDYLRIRKAIRDTYDIKKLPTLPNNLEGTPEELHKAIRAKHGFCLKIYIDKQDEMVRLKNKALEDNYQKNVYPKAKEFEGEFGDYIISAPTSVFDLVIEGRKLSHCVGSYVESVSEGREYILYLRKKSAPNESFYTIDITPDKKVRQIHGKCNCNLTPELMPIVTTWAAKFDINIKNTDGIYGALHNH